MIPDELRGFFDLEAQENGSDSSSEEEEDSGFIDDTDIGQRPEKHVVVSRNLAMTQDCPVDADRAKNNLIARISARYVPSAVKTRAEGSDEVADHLLGQGVSSAGMRLGSPGPSNWAIWRVGCKLGLEDQLVVFLLQKTKPRHELRSAFTQASIRSWVYLETTMNRDLSRLLQFAPGVTRSHDGFVRYPVEEADHMALLRMRKTIPSVTVGSWVRICAGLYKGDVGYVVEMGSGEDASVLLVPRLKLPQPAETIPAKRKRYNQRPKPVLFNASNIEKLHKIEPVKLDDKIYHFMNNRFEHGLLRKCLSIRSISQTCARPPTSLFELLRDSGHPAICVSRFPRPLEWIFEEDEEVQVVSMNKRGVIVASQSDMIEVDLNTQEGIIEVRWNDIRKHMSAGNFVEVLSGPHRGKTAWVVSVEGNIAHVVQHILSPVDTTKELEFHVNWLKVTSVPFSYEAQPPLANTSSHTLRAGPTPWLGTRVVIYKQGHPMKGHAFIVRDVLVKQKTASGLRLGVELAHMDPTAPFQRKVVDYDDVVEARLKCRLYDYQRPTSSDFLPNNYTPTSRLPHREETSETNVCASTSTLMLESSLSTPAWDPSSRTPLPNPSLNDDTASLDFQNQMLPRSPSHSSAPPISPTQDPSPQSPPEPLPGASVEEVNSVSGSREQATITHPLLTPQLVGVQLKVLVTGGGYTNKEVVVTLEERDGQEGQLSFRYTKRNRPIWLEQRWVTPKYPNPARDKGAMVVIKGEHCGKYVRRIHLRYEHEEAIMILAVVKRTEGVVKGFTGEQLELKAHDVCVVNETKEEKTMLDAMLEAIRQEARKTRAK